jgi:hypothetical protein
VRAPATRAPTPIRFPTRRRGVKTFEMRVVILAAAVVVPLVVTIASLIGYDWHPAQDHAVEVLQIRDVGGLDTPLVGAYSRYGWDHPGPLLFWVLAPFYWAFGATGVLVGVALLNGVALVGALIVARRRGGFPLMVVVALTLAVLCHALGAELLIDPWNPWVPVLPFFAFVMLAWSVAGRDWVALPWLVGVGSFVVQAHVGYAPLVGGFGIVAGILALLHGRRLRRPATTTTALASPNHRSARVSILVAGLLGGLLWLAPVVQQLTGSPGNLGEIVRSFREPADPFAGWEIAFGTMGHELQLWGPWITGHDPAPFGYVQQASTIPAIVLLIVTGAFGVLAWRRGRKAPGQLAIIAVVGAALAVVAISRISGAVYPHLVRWTWVIAALVWLSLAWSICSLLPRKILTGVLLAGLALAVVLSAITAWSATSVGRPLERESDAISQLGPDVAAHLNSQNRYMVTWVEEPVPATGIGMMLELIERGFHVGAGRVRAPRSLPMAHASRVDGVITIVERSSQLESGWVPPAEARMIAEYDPLTPSQRTQELRLERHVRSVLGPEAVVARPLDNALAREWIADAMGPNGTDVVEKLWKLQRRGEPYTVYLHPAQHSAAGTATAR